MRTAGLDFTAIDFETANSSRSSVCAVGLVMFRGGEEAARLRQLIRPEPCHFDPFNISIHGISQNDVADAPTFAQFWPELWARVSGPLVAHNAAFDMSVLRHALDQAGLRYPEADYFCTRVVARLAWPQHPTYALDYIATSLGIAFQHHDAEEDARACAIIAISACAHLGTPSLYDLQDAYGLGVGRLYEHGYDPCRGPCAPRPAAMERDRQRSGRVSSAASELDEGHPYFGRSFVFTGALLSMQRRDAMQAVVDRGGACHDTVKADTDYLVIGQKGFIGYQDGYKSSKIVKVERMRSAGFSIEILSESDFLDLM
jgi:DNA polymerase III subunit epsilon